MKVCCRKKKKWNLDGWRTRTPRKIQTSQLRKKQKLARMSPEAQEEIESIHADLLGEQKISPAEKQRTSSTKSDRA